MYYQSSQTNYRNQNSNNLFPFLVTGRKEGLQGYELKHEEGSSPQHHPAVEYPPKHGHAAFLPSNDNVNGDGNDENQDNAANGTSVANDISNL